VKISTQWLNEAKKLCDEIGPEDGVDPRLLVKAHRTKNNSRKTMQLCKEAKHTLSLVMAGELIKRKRVPALKFQLARAQQEVNENAYSENH